jgi:hypothetical protein
MDQTDHPRLAASELNAVNLIEAPVYNGKNAKIGTVAHVYGEDATLEVIVDIGGFMLIGPKPVSLMASQLEFTWHEDGQVHIETSLSQSELAALLEHIPPERR